VLRERNGTGSKNDGKRYEKGERGANRRQRRNGYKKRPPIHISVHIPYYCTCIVAARRNIEEGDCV
jgi:hypothetical protein